MEKRWQVSGLLTVVLSAFVFFGACNNEPKEDPKPGNQEGQGESKEPKETEPFKAFPDASSDTNRMMSETLPYFQAVIDGKGSLGSVVAIVRPDGVTIKGLGTFAAEKDPGSINFELASITKVFTGMAFASMVNDGILKLDTKLAACKPQNLDIEVPDITLGQLTSHTSGLPFDMKEVDNSSVTFYTKTSDKALWEGLATNKQSKSKIGKYNYSNYGVALLGSALAHCDGEENWLKVVEKRVLKPLGLEGISPSAVKTADHDINFEEIPGWDWSVIDAGAHAALRGNAKQLARLAQMMMSSDNFIGHRMLKKSQEHVFEFPNPLEEIYSAIGFNWLIGYNNNFVNYIFTDKDGEELLEGLVESFTGMVYHGGSARGHLTEFIVAPEQKLAIIMLSDSRSSSGIDQAYALIFAFGYLLGLNSDEDKELLQHYSDVLLPPVVDLPADKKARLVGDYNKRFSDGVETLSISLDASSDIWFSMTSWEGEKYRAWPLSESVLTSAAVGDITFTLPEDSQEGASSASIQFDQGTNYVFNRAD